MGRPELEVPIVDMLQIGMASTKYAMNGELAQRSHDPAIPQFGSTERDKVP